MKRHIRWQFRGKIKCDDHALSEVIGTILTVSVVITIASGIMFWGEPYMSELTTKAVSAEVENKLNIAIEQIRDVSLETPGATRTFRMDINKGTFKVDNIGDRLVVSYSTIPGYDFTVSGLDDNDNKFKINLLSGGNLDYAKVYWFTDEQDAAPDALSGGPDFPCEPIPYHDETNLSLDPTLSVMVRDPEGDAMTVSFYDDVSGPPPIDTDDVASGTRASVDWSGRSPATTYTWYVTADDGSNNVTSQPFSFTTRDANEYIQWLDSPADYDVVDSNITLAWDEGSGSNDLEYQYKLDGYVDAWSGWADTKNVVYQNLPDQNYTFRVNFRQPGSANEDETCRIFTVANGIKKVDHINNLNSDTFSCSKNLKGMVRIDLYDDLDDTLSTNDVVFGNIFFCDLGLLEHKYPSTTGTEISILENNGLFSVNQKAAKRNPNIVIDPNYITFRIIQLRHLDSYFTGGSGSLRFTSTVFENNIRDLFTDAFNVTVQVFGEYEDVWQSYLTLHGFSEEGDTYKVNTGGSLDTVVEYDPDNDGNAIPKAGQLGGLCAVNPFGVPFVFKDINGNWAYDNGESIDVKAFGSDYVVQPFDIDTPGGLIAYDDDTGEPYIFLDTSEPYWEYDASDNNGDGNFYNDNPFYLDPDFDTISATPVPANKDPGGLLSIDSNNEPYTFKDLYSADWEFGSRLTLSQVLCKVGFS